MELRYASFEIECTLTAAGEFPPYKGSMLRGAFGQSLRRAVCTVRGGQCEDCLLKNTCPFPQLFEGKSILTPKKQHITVPPYCIEPPAEKQNSYDVGSIFTFTLVLFSYATDYLPYFIHAFSLMGQKGLGSIRDGMRGTFSINDVKYDGISIFDAKKVQLTPFVAKKIPAPQWNLEQGSFSNTSQHGCQIHLLTPLRFKQHNALASTLSFEQIMLLCLRRAKALYALEELEYMVDNFTEGMDLIKTIQSQEQSIHWYDWTRYSGRQGKAMQFGGIVGNATYTGNIAPFIPLLDFATQGHLGKQTSFGLGKFSYSCM